MIYDTGKHRWAYKQPIYENGVEVRWLLGPCPKCGYITSTYGSSFTCHNDHCSNSAGNFASSAEPKPEWWGDGTKVFLDGTAWCAVKADFMNLQESPAGFGDTPKAAVIELHKENSCLK
jgi:hypothetical protein